MGLLFTVGVLLLLLGLVALVAKFLKNEDWPAFLQKFAQVKVATIMIIVSMPLLMVNSLFFIAEDGHNYYVQYPTGGYKVHTEIRGITWRGFAKITDWKDYITVSSEQKEGSGHFAPTPIRFSDKVTGVQQITARFKLPDDPEKFRSLVKEFRTQQNLINSTLISTIREVVSNSPYMFTGQGYASGEAPDYKFAVRDQLMNGTYILESKEKRNIAREKLNKDSLTIVGGIEESNAMDIKVPKEGPDGKLLRIMHAISNSGIIITQVTLPDVDFKDTFDKKLEEQRAQSAKIQEFAIKEKAQAQEALYQKALGEKNKIVEQMTQEKAAVKQIIAMQTQLQKDSIAYKQSLVRKSTITVNAKSLRIKKDAEAYANMRLVSAGLTPQEKAEWKYKTAVGIAAEIAKMKTPQTVIMGGSKGSMSTEALVQLQILNTLKK